MSETHGCALMVVFAFVMSIIVGILSAVMHFFGIPPEWAIPIAICGSVGIFSLVGVCCTASAVPPEASDGRKRRRRPPVWACVIYVAVVVCIWFGGAIGTGYWLREAWSVKKEIAAFTGIAWPLALFGVFMFVAWIVCGVLEFVIPRTPTPPTEGEEQP